MNNTGWRERWRDYWRPREVIDTSPRVSDEVKYTTCYMCAGRCGIKVHLKDGGVRYIEGNPRHPVNRGVICGKGAAGIMHQQSPAKLRWMRRQSTPWASPLRISSTALTSVPVFCLAWTRANPASGSPPPSLRV